MKDEMGGRIKAARARKGLTQAEAANKSGLGDAAVRLYELGKRTPSDEILARVAETLGVSSEALMNLTPSTEREALEVLFRLEEAYGCSPEATADGVSVSFDKTSVELKDLIIAWSEELKRLDTGEITSEDYAAWKASI